MEHKISCIERVFLEKVFLTLFGPFDCFLSSTFRISDKNKYRKRGKFEMAQEDVRIFLVLLVILLKWLEIKFGSGFGSRPAINQDFGDSASQ